MSSALIKRGPRGDYLPGEYYEERGKLLLLPPAQYTLLGSLDTKTFWEVFDILKSEATVHRDAYGPELRMFVAACACAVYRESPRVTKSELASKVITWLQDLGFELPYIDNETIWNCTDSVRTRHARGRVACRQEGGVWTFLQSQLKFGDKPVWTIDWRGFKRSHRPGTRGKGKGAQAKAAATSRKRRKPSSSTAPSSTTPSSTSSSASSSSAGTSRPTSKPSSRPAARPIARPVAIAARSTAPSTVPASAAPASGSAARAVSSAATPAVVVPTLPLPASVPTPSLHASSTPSRSDRDFPTSDAKRSRLNQLEREVASTLASTSSPSFGPVTNTSGGSSPTTTTTSMGTSPLEFLASLAEHNGPAVVTPAHRTPVPSSSGVPPVKPVVPRTGNMGGAHRMARNPYMSTSVAPGSHTMRPPTMVSAPMGSAPMELSRTRVQPPSVPVAASAAPPTVSTGHRPPTILSMGANTKVQPRPTKSASPPKPAVSGTKSGFRDDLSREELKDMLDLLWPDVVRHSSTACVDGPICVKSPSWAVQTLHEAQPDLAQAIIGQLYVTRSRKSMTPPTNCSIGCALTALVEILSFLQRRLPSYFPSFKDVTVSKLHVEAVWSALSELSAKGVTDATASLSKFESKEHLYTTLADKLATQASSDMGGIGVGLGIARRDSVHPSSGTGPRSAMRSGPPVHIRGAGAPMHGHPQHAYGSVHHGSVRPVHGNPMMTNPMHTMVAHSAPVQHMSHGVTPQGHQGSLTSTPLVVAPVSA